jgi:xanthine/CO dehydrogenase XdhC/CoxF family maturation factor
MANNINLLIDAYRRLKQTPENVVLATIIETFGSTYQKAGAKMLIAMDGELTGLLGGGCFEKDLPTRDTIFVNIQVSDIHLMQQDKWVLRHLRKNRPTSLVRLLSVRLIV